MNCQQYCDDLTAYMDGELAPSRSRELTSHLGQCRSCREELRALQASAEIVEPHINDLEPAPEMWNNLHSRIAVMPAPAAFGGFFGTWLSSRWLKAAVGAAAAVVLAVGMWGTMNYLSYQREVRQYMSDYIRERELEEEALRVREVNAPAEGTRVGTPQAMEPANPFGVIRTVSFDNPFKTEGQ
jgi:anti-sigma factor RsiW